MVAYKLLTGEAEIDIDQSTFSPDLYKGISICNKSNIHLHIKHDQGFIYGLINNARAEILEEFVVFFFFILNMPQILNF